MTFVVVRTTSTTRPTDKLLSFRFLPSSQSSCLPDVGAAAAENEGGRSSVSLFVYSEKGVYLYPLYKGFIPLPCTEQQCAMELS